MAEALLIKTVWLFLPLMLSHVSAQSFSVVVPQTPVSGVLGGSVTLPCALSDNLDVRKLEVRWYRPSMYNRPTLLYQNEKQEPSADVDQQGRVSLPGPLEKGDVSLKLENLRLTDVGMYICHVSSDRWYDKNNMSLIIQAVGSSPLLSMVDVEEGKVNVSCHSPGWWPKPTLNWRDSEGRSLGPPNEHTYIKGSEGLFSVSSWLLFSPSESRWVSCSVALPGSVGMIRESRVMPHVPADDGIWKVRFLGVLILLLLCIIGVGVYCVLQRTGLIGSKRKKTEGREAENQTPESKVEMQPLLDPQTEDKPLQTVFIPVNHDQKPEPNLNSSPSAETQVLYQEEEQQLQPQTEDTPHQPESTGGNHDYNPHRNQTSSPPAGGSQYQEAAANQDSASSAEGVQDHNVGTNQNPASSAGGGQGPSSEVNQHSASSAGGGQGPSSEVNQHSASSAGGDQGPSSEVNHSLSSSAEENHKEDCQLNVNLPPSAAGWQQVKGFKVNITIDPEETPHFFKTTRADKRVNCLQPIKDHENVESKIFTLCRESFSSGQQCWEVMVKEHHNEKLSWFVGVATEEAERVHRIPLTPENGFWVLCYEQEKGVYIRESAIMPTPLPAVGDDLRVIGVFLDCDNHMLSFYNAETQSHIYTFTSVTLRTSLRPLISPGVRDIIPVHIC